MDDIKKFRRELRKKIDGEYKSLRKEALSGSKKELFENAWKYMVLDDAYNELLWMVDEECETDINILANIEECDTPVADLAYEIEGDRALNVYRDAVSDICFDLFSSKEE